MLSAPGWRCCQHLGLTPASQGPWKQRRLLVGWGVLLRWVVKPKIVVLKMEPPRGREADSAPEAGGTAGPRYLGLRASGNRFPQWLDQYVLAYVLWLPEVSDKSLEIPLFLSPPPPHPKVMKPTVSFSLQMRRGREPISIKNDFRGGRLLGAPGTPVPGQGRWRGAGRARAPSWATMFLHVSSELRRAGFP